MKNRKFILFSLILAFISSLPFNASGDSGKKSIFDALAHKDVTEVKIKTDLEALLGDLRSEEKRVATFSYKNENNDWEELDIRLKLRGKFRRMNCTSTPPLKIYFDKEQLKAAGLAKYDDLKLVNYCHDDKAIAMDLLSKEFMAYKLYNELTAHSFRVQMLKITYQDTKSSKKIKQYAFVIEDTAQLRKRNGLSKVEQEFGFTNGQYHQELAYQVALFQFMIGNADWSLNFEKNIKVLEKNDQMIPVPYDFDFSGLVNPPYGAVNSGLGISNLKDRVYLGYLDDEELLLETIQLFKEKKDAILAAVKKSKHLYHATKTEMKIYLSEFFDQLNATYVSSNVPVQFNALRQAHAEED